MVTSWGTGRRDYSENVEMSVIPVARSYQLNATAYETFTLTANEQQDIPIDMTFSGNAENHFIFYINVTVDANVLIKVEIWSDGVRFTSEQGYQEVNIYIPQGLGLSDVTLRVQNLGDVSVSGAYSHNGVQGTEKIMPTPAG